MKSIATLAGIALLVAIQRSTYAFVNHPSPKMIVPKCRFPSMLKTRLHRKFPVVSSSRLSQDVSSMGQDPIENAVIGHSVDNSTIFEEMPILASIENITSPTYPPTPTLKECLAFTLPALGIYACPTLMSLIDASFIGRTSSLELAALGPACSISDSSSLPLLFLSIGATNLVATSFAKGDEVNSARITRTTLGLGFVCSVFLAAMLYRVAGPMSLFYCSVGQQPGSGGFANVLAPLCAEYISIRALAIPAVVIATIAQAVCIGIRDTKTPLKAVALSGCLNLLGDFILVDGLKMGIAGAAWATAASQLAGAGLLLRVLHKRGLLRRESDSIIKSTDAKLESDSSATTTRTTILSLMSFIPFLFVMGVKIGMHNACAATAASLGGARAAAHTALLSVAMLCFTFGDVGSSLSQAFLPAFSKLKDQKEKSSSLTESKYTFDLPAAVPTIQQLLKCTWSISATVVTIASALLTIFSGSITSDPAVMKQMRTALPFMVATLSLHSTAVTLEGLLLARKNFRALTLTYIGVAISVTALLTLVQRSGVGLLGVWAVYVWFQASRIVAFSSFGGLVAHFWKSASQKWQIFMNSKERRKNLTTMGLNEI